MIELRSWILKSVVMPAADRVYGHPMMRRLKFLEEAQWWPAERVAAERNRLLRETVEIAYRDVAFYRESMNRRRLKPEDIREPSDLSKLPVVTKPMLRDGYPQRTTRNTGLPTTEERTSGSTGTNFTVLEDRETAAWYRATFLLSLEWSGWRFGAAHAQTGITATRNRARRLKDAVLRCYYMPAYDLRDSTLEAHLDVLDHQRIDYLWGYPGTLYFLAKHAMQRGWNRPLRSIVTWGDMLYPHYRELIEKAFSARIYDTYGCGEGMQISAQCGQGANYHVYDLDVIPEYVDDAGNPVSLNQPGRLLLTRLHPGAMPFIRYQIGDTAVAGDQSPCPCGRAWGRMERILGRDTDVVLAPSGNRLVVHYFTGILEHFHEVSQFQVVQEDRDRVNLLVVPTPTFSSDTPRRLETALRARGAEDLQFRVECVNDIPLPKSGKHRFIVNRLQFR
jgi:phenylacetate-CoA ligase